MSSISILKFGLQEGKRIVKGQVKLTGSKSECNRALVMQALSKGKVRVNNISNAADTVTLQQILLDAPVHLDKAATVDVGPAGTAMRFLTAYFTLLPGLWTLTGTERMKQRPIGILVDALSSLGADITYAGQDGYPPITINGGTQQQSADVSIRGDVSSQYITALLLIAANLEKGLNIHIEGELTSVPYVKMTLELLAQSGIKHQWTNNVISVAPQAYKESTITVEPDWSAASYWYTVAALADEANIQLPYLRQSSLQGDSRIAQIMEHFGVGTTYDNEGISLHKIPVNTGAKYFDLKDCPDLAQTVIVCSAALGYNATFTGLETLKIKETDRIKALQNELAKIGVVLTEDGLDYHLDCSKKSIPEKVQIKTYEDHRMAMAFAPLAMIIPEVHIEEPLVVEKSYPQFWEHLAHIGFEIK